jgi:hypothetical protein
MVKTQSPQLPKGGAALPLQCHYRQVSQHKTQAFLTCSERYLPSELAAVPLMKPLAVAAEVILEPLVLTTVPALKHDY